jgi:hypothetical protein
MNFMMTPLKKVGNGIRAVQAFRNRRVAFKALGQLDADGLRSRLKNGLYGKQFIDVNSRVLFGGTQGGFLGVGGKKTYRIVGENLANPELASFHDLQVVRPDDSLLKIMERNPQTARMTYFGKPDVDGNQHALFARQPVTSDHLTTALRQPLRTVATRTTLPQVVVQPPTSQVDPDVNTPSSLL